VRFGSSGASNGVHKIYPQFFHQVGVVMALETELQTYQKRRAELLAHEGKFVLIHGEEVAGIWDTYEDALKTGYEKYGLEPFMVKRIVEVEAVNYSTRHTPCLS
jgi:hypothetical protein